MAGPNLPRIAVLGGGVAGCAAAARLHRLGAQVTLVEMGRSVGGRATTRRTREDKRVEIDHGAPMAQILTPEGMTMAEKLAAKGFIEPFAGQIGRITAGSSDFRANEESQAVFVGKQCMEKLCAGLMDGADVTSKFGSMVRTLSAVLDDDGKVSGWRILGKDDALVTECDWLVVAGNAVAHSRWTKTFGGEPPLVKAAAAVKDPQLDTAIAAVEGIGARPLQVIAMGFEGEAAGAWSSLPFVAAEVEGDELIGKILVQQRNGMVFVVAHSTHKWAEDGDTAAFGAASAATRVGGAAYDATKEADVQAEMLKGVERCVAGFSPTPSTEGATFGPFIHRWGGAFPDGSAFPSMEDAFVPSSRVVFAGDYVGQRSGSIEGAMLSGESAADLISEYVAKSG